MPGSAPAGAEEIYWRADPAESRLEFEGRSASTQGDAPPMVVLAALTEWTADIRYDPEEPEEARVSVRMNLASIKAFDALVTQTVKSRDWLAAEAYSEASYEARGFTVIDEDRFATEGILHLHGAKHAVRLEFTISITGDTAFAEGEGVVDRFDFGVGANIAEAMAERLVRVRFRVLARRVGD